MLCASIVPAVRMQADKSGRVCLCNVIAKPLEACGCSTGDGGYGQLGAGNYDNTNKPVRVATDTAFQSITCGDDHTCALDFEGKAWCWGERQGVLRLLWCISQGRSCCFGAYLNLQVHG